MGLRFGLETANWLAYLLQPDASVPRLEDPWQEREALRLFLEKLDRHFYSSHRREREFAQYVDRARRILERADYQQGEVPASVLRELR